VGWDLLQSAALLLVLGLLRELLELLLRLLYAALRAHVLGRDHRQRRHGAVYRADRRLLLVLRVALLHRRR
jgi:hypothetical protein